MLMSLLSLLGGGLMRALPEVVGLWNKKTDNAHELAMMDKQIQLEQQRAGAKHKEIVTQGDIDQTIALLSAQGEALKSQMQKTGIKAVDALNFLVRPLTTYFFLGMFGLVKLAMLIVALRSADPWTAILLCWSAEDAAIFSGILSFWFVGRVFDKKQQ